MSDTGDLLVVGNADSTVKVFWLNRASLMRSLGSSECNNPFAD